MERVYVRLNPATMVEDDNGVIYLKETVDETVSYQARNEYYLKVITDKPQILSNGTDVMSITVELYNYLDEFQSQSNEEVYFSMDRSIIAENFIDGVCEIEFSSAEAGEYFIQVQTKDSLDCNVKVVVV